MFPNFKIHPCIALESVPPGTNPPESFGSTYSTKFSMTLIGMSIGVSAYVYSVDARSIFSCGCFPARTVMDFFWLVLIYPKLAHQLRPSPICIQNVQLQKIFRARQYWKMSDDLAPCYGGRMPWLGSL